MSAHDLALLLDAAAFAAERHRHQKRKGLDASPYINHPIEVARTLATVGGVTDVVTLAAAILHDTIEDTRTTPEELEARFGAAVREVVEEVTDDKRLPKAERKRLQVSHAATCSARAKLVKLGDKLCNARDIAERPPHDWPVARRREYLDWTEQVIAGCRGTNAALERAYDETIAAARERLTEVAADEP